jgi:hypothetical protein
MEFAKIMTERQAGRLSHHCVGWQSRLTLFYCEKTYLCVLDFKESGRTVLNICHILPFPDPLSE